MFVNVTFLFVGRNGDEQGWPPGEDRESRMVPWWPGGQQPQGATQIPQVPPIWRQAEEGPHPGRIESADQEVAHFLEEEDGQEGVQVEQESSQVVQEMGVEIAVRQVG